MLMWLRLRLNFYGYDSNVILAETTKYRSKRELTQAFTKLRQHLADRGLKPVLQIMDKKFPHSLKCYMQSIALDCQLSSPHIHLSTGQGRPLHQYACI